MKTRLTLFTLILLLPLMAWSQTVITEANGTLEGLGHARTHDFPVEARIFTVTLSEADTSGMRSVYAEVSVNDIYTGNAMRTSHMRMSVLDRKKHPLITFKSNFLLLELQAGKVTLPGELQINGVVKAYDLNLELTQDMEQWHATGSFLIIPTDFDLPLVGMGPMKVLDKVDLNLDVKF